MTRQCFFMLLMAMTICILVSVPTGVHAQPTANDVAPLPQTAWGDPDLQGVWDFRTITPMERPDELADKEFLTDEEAAEVEEARRDRDSGRDDEVPADIVGNYNEFWFDRGTDVITTRRTSLVVEPLDGRVPPLTPEAEQKQVELQEARRGTGTHQPTPGGWVEDLGSNGLQVRCITGFNSGPPMTPGGYNNNVQLFQTPTEVVLLNEMNHNVRIVPLDQRSRGDLRQWAGDSHGYWDGDTLVVETTNFLRETSFMRGQSSADLHLVERFTRTSSNMLLYRVTVEDPMTWTKPWTYEVPMLRSEAPIYEYACHEGNYAMEVILAGARAEEQTP